MIRSAQRYGELIAHLAAQRFGLGKAQMVGVGGLSSANETRLRGDELSVPLVPQPTG